MKIVFRRFSFDSVITFGSYWSRRREK